MKKIKDRKNRIFKKPIFLKILNLILITLCIILIGMKILGFEFCSVVSGSMEPTIPTWSLAIVDTKISYEELNIGDIVVFKNNKIVKTEDGSSANIIHRIIDGDCKTGFTTKGDHNDVNDGITVTKNTYIGKELFHIPLIGLIMMLVNKYKKILIILLVIVAFINIIKNIYYATKNITTNSKK